MPIGAAIGIGSAVAGVGTALGARSQSRAATHASDLQAEGLRRQQEIDAANEQRRRAEYDQAQAQARAQWDAEQARRAPYREAAEGLLRQRAADLGFPVPAPSVAPTFSYPAYDPHAPMSRPLTPTTNPVVMRPTLVDLAQPGTRTLLTSASAPLAAAPPLAAPSLIDPTGLAALAQPRMRRV